MKFVLPVECAIEGPAVCPFSVNALRPSTAAQSFRLVLLRTGWRISKCDTIGY